MSGPRFAPAPSRKPTAAHPAGSRVDLGDLDGVRIVVVVLADGEREMHLLTADDNEPVAMFQFTADQAQGIAQALSAGGP